MMRVVGWLVLLGFLAMLYWSSLVVEERLERIEGAIRGLSFQHTGGGVEQTHAEPSLVDATLPNLLTEDPFYEKTLPKLLGKDFYAHGVRETASIAKPDNLHPFTQWADVSSWRSRCQVSVAKGHVGIFETYAPQAAYKMEERQVDGQIEYWVHLRNDLQWQPLSADWFPSSIQLAPQFLQAHPVTAHDFKFFFDAVMNPFVTEPSAVTMKMYYSDIESFRVLNNQTFVVRWKGRPKYAAKSWVASMEPLASFVYQYFPDGSKIVEEVAEDTYRTNSTWAQNFAQHWAKNVIPSCGPMQFTKMTDEAIVFSRNPQYFSPLEMLVEQNRILFKQSADTVFQAFKQGSIDSLGVPPEQLSELKRFLESKEYAAQQEPIHQLRYMMRAFSYVGWNMTHPLFANKKVRQAMTMAIDRHRLIAQVLNGMGEAITCPFYPSSIAYDATLKPWAYDPLLARKWLEEEGFADVDGDGVLEKGAIKAEFRLTYYVKNATARAVVDFIATALKPLGVRCIPHGVEMADLSALFDDKAFDAYLLGWALGAPPEDPRQIWHSSGAKEKGSSNAVGFAHARADQIIDALTYEYNLAEREKLYHELDAILHEEEPYTLLYAPYVLFAYRDRLRNVFILKDRQDLIPGADIAEPDPSIFYLKTGS